MKASDAELDYRAVMSSVEHLRRSFAATWPFDKVMYPGRTVPWEEYSQLTDAWEQKVKGGS